MGASTSISEYWTVAERQKFLAPNERCLTRIRQALAQDYLTPRNADLEDGDDRLAVYQLQELLRFAAITYEDAGNRAEALRCSLDILELGVVLPRGGTLHTRESGNMYEETGRQLAWHWAGKVEAKTARLAVARLENVEARRWPLIESLREDLWSHNAAYQKSEFELGPLYAWEKKSWESATKRAEEPGEPDPNSARALWGRAVEVYSGPKHQADEASDRVKRAQERLNQPWQPHRPELDFQCPYRLHEEYSNTEAEDYFSRTQAALLRAYLALRAFKLEHGSYPQSLETLVTEGYLKAVPIDAFSPTRAPLGYKPDGTLWSVGPDAKDDGGKPIPEKDRPWDTREPLGDLVPGSDSFSARLSSL